MTNATTRYVALARPTKALHAHDCDQCTLVANLFSSDHTHHDVYTCGLDAEGGEKTVIIRHSGEGPDYSSFPAAWPTATPCGPPPWPSSPSSCPAKEVRTMTNKTRLALLGLCTAATLAALGLAGAAKASYEVLARPNYGNEGMLLRAPAGGPRQQVLHSVEPGLMSIVFTDRRVAEEYYAEAAGNGERVCLADLGPQPSRAHGQRWWLFTC